MNKLKVSQCHGEGLGSCKRCSDHGIWNRIWMSFLYKIEGYAGWYCSYSVQEIIGENEGNWKIYKRIKIHLF